MQKLPIDEAIAARNTAGRAPYPDPEITRRQQLRAVKPPPVDLLAVTGEGPSADTARHAMRNLHETWTLIHDSAKNFEVELKELTKVGQNALKRGLKSADAAGAKINEQIAHIDSKIKAATQPNITPQMAAEIRSMVRDDPKRAAGLCRSDARIASAILGGPAALSGLDEKTYEVARQSALLAHAPDEVGQRKVAEAALAALNRAGSSAVANLQTKLLQWEEATPVSLDKLRAAT